MRIVIGCLMHESNTFSKIPTDISSFKNTQLLTGRQIIDHHKGNRTEIGGMLSALAGKRARIIPTIAAVALPSGIVKKDTYNYLKEQFLTAIRESKDPDGILFALHGSMVAEGVDDPEADLLQETREIVGDDVLMGITLDLHANVSDAMVSNADFLLGYRTHPHTDQWERGEQAGRIMISLLEKRIKPVKSFLKLPFILPAETSPEPREKILRKIQGLEKEDGILTASFFLGYPWADVPVIGPAVVVVAKENTKLAEEGTSRLAQLARELRDDFPLPTLSVDDAINEAMTEENGPIVLCDMGDCLFGGASGDVTTFLSALKRRKAANAALAAIVDPDAVQKTIRAGVGKMVKLKVGGKLDRDNSEPVQVEGKVKLIVSNPQLEDSIHRSYEVNMGYVAVLELPYSTDLILAERGGKVYEPAFLRNLGIDPERKKIIILKDAFCPILTYKDMAREVILVDSPGWCCQNLKKINYRRAPHNDFGETPNSGTR